MEIKIDVKVTPKLFFELADNLQEKINKVSLKLEKDSDEHDFEEVLSAQKKLNAMREFFLENCLEKGENK